MHLRAISNRLGEVCRLEVIKRIAGPTMFIVLGLLSARADWRFDAESGAFYDSNLSRSDRAADEQEDWAWKSDVRLGNGFQLSRDLRLNLSGDVGGRIWGRFSAFNSVALGGSAGFRYRFSLGRQAPWLAVEDRLAYELFEENERSGWDNKFRISGGVGLTDRISVEAAYFFENFAARDGFFDRTGHSGVVRLAIDVTSSLQMALGYGYRDGDVISYAVPPRPDILLLTSETKPVESFDIPYVAYRLQGSTHTISLSAGYALTKSMSIQVAYEYLHTCHDPLEYENHVVEAKFVVAY